MKERVDNLIMDEPESIDELTPEFKDDREKSLFSVAQMGLAAQQFMDSQIGRYVTDRMNETVEDCAHALLEADTIEDVRVLQRKADIAEESLRWIVEAISEGDAAYQQLQET